MIVGSLPQCQQHRTQKARLKSHEIDLISDPIAESKPTLNPNPVYVGVKYHPCLKTARRKTMKGRYRKTNERVGDHRRLYKQLTLLPVRPRGGKVYSNMKLLL